jgi:hypothetical protein
VFPLAFKFVRKDGSPLKSCQTAEIETQRARRYIIPAPLVPLKDQTPKFKLKKPNLPKELKQSPYYDSTSCEQ